MIMEYELKRIDEIEDVVDLWPYVKGNIEEALKYSKDGYTIDDVLRDLLSRKMQLWIIISNEQKIVNVFVTELNEYDVKTLHFYLLGAESLETVAEWSVNQVIKWAKSCGAERAEILGRLGWEKVMEPLGFKKTHVLLSKEI